MSREIKFRAWDGKKMWPVEGLSFAHVAGIAALQRVQIWLEDKSEMYWLNAKHANLMQYTALKDKNGTEIYEGDIVEHRNYIKGLLGTYEVKQEAWSFTLVDPSKPEVTSHYISPDQLEVVGNKYDNPELVK